MSIKKLGMCEMCQKNESKYKCPRCETITCSLPCVKAHKKLKNFCDGIRDKTKFVPLKDFSSMELVSDLSLLEEAARYSVSKEPEPIKKHNENGKNQAIHPKAFEALQRACNRRNKCRLLGLPKHFSRHLQNASTYDTPNDTILWTISWILPHHCNEVKHVYGVSEKSRLRDLIEEVLENSHSSEEFSIYKMSRMVDLKALLKCESLSHATNEGNNERYIELDMEKSLVWNLQGKVVVEHPIIVIVQKTHSSFYQEGGGDFTEHVQDETEVHDSSFDALNFMSNEEEQGKTQTDQEEIDHKPQQVNHEEKEQKPETDSLERPTLSCLVSYPSSDEET